jgi:hypothetical protein
MFDNRPSLAEEYQRRAEAYVAARGVLAEVEDDYRRASIAHETARTQVGKAEQLLRETVGGNIRTRTFLVSDSIVLVEYNPDAANKVTQLALEPAK